MFRMKSRNFFTCAPTKFNGSNWSTADETITMTKMIRSTRSSSTTTKKTFTIQRALAQYIGVNMCPYVCANFQLVAPGADEASKEEHKSFFKTIEHFRKAS